MPSNIESRRGRSLFHRYPYMGYGTGMKLYYIARDGRGWVAYEGDQSRNLTGAAVYGRTLAEISARI